MSIPRFALLAPAALALSLGCTGISRELSCEQNSECVRDGVTGVCMPPGHCAFEDGACPSGYRWDSTAGDSLAEECVGEGGGDPDAGDTNACGGTAVLEGAPQSPCGPCDSGTYECAGPDAVECTGAVSLSSQVTLLSAGRVEAETTFENDDSFRAELAADDKLSTSWFSDGPNEDGSPTVFEWIADEEICVETVTMYGNGNHEVEDFQTGYGFGQVTMRVLDESGDPTYAETIQLPGTPDPEAIAQTGGVLGARVQLQLKGHEDPQGSCGGFAELAVTELE